MTKILLVEDDKSLREIYGVRLLAEGYDIVSAGDGEEALAMAIKERPQLIVSDVMMPKISGFDMLDILRSTTETREIKVIMMTALSSDDQRARGEQLGADRYLVKSQVGIEDVVRTVHDVLGDAGTTQAPTTQPVPTSDPTPVESTSPVAPPEETSLPLPTAPFSSPRPATLGERVINPIESSESTVSASVKSQIEQELQAPVVPVTSTQVDQATDDAMIAAQLSVTPQSAPAEPQQPINPVMGAPYPQQPVTSDDDNNATSSTQPTAPQPPVSPLS